MKKLIDILKSPVQTMKYFIVFIHALLLVISLVTGQVMWWKMFWIGEFFCLTIWFVETTQGKTWKELFTTLKTKEGYYNLMEI